MSRSPSPLVMLVSSAGRRVALIKCFRDAAAALTIDLRVVAVDADPTLSSACAVADISLPVPRCTDPAFVDSILEVVQEQRVSLVVPTIDTELEAYAAARVSFREAGAWVSVPPPDVVALARDKLATAERLRAAGVAVPRTVALMEALAEAGTFSGPVVVKPRDGSASTGLRILQSIEQVTTESFTEVQMNGGLVVQERLIGPEYTVNMFFDRSGKLRSAVPHRRLEVRAGEVSKARTVRDQRLMDQSIRMGAVLEGATGSLCYQAIDVAPEEEPRVIELNARFGGGYPIAQEAGASFARWLLEEAMGLPPSARDLADWREGVTMLRYDAAVFSSS